jgi:hypothetical protein
MTSLPAPTEQVSLATLHEQDARDLRALLIEMAQQGAELAALYVQQAKDQAYSGKPGAGPSPECATAYKEVSRSVRQSAMLALKITAPAPAPKADESAPRRAAVRRQVIRGVEDAIHRDAPADQVESLRAEFLERLETPEFGDDFDQRPAVDIVNDIRADLGIFGESSLTQWKRRMPADIAILYARAAGQTPVAPDVPPPPDWADPEPERKPAADWDDTKPIRGP